MAIAVFFVANTFGQKRKGPDREKVKAYKIAYITDQLNLSSEEAQKFWPVYNEHEDKMDAMRKQENQSVRKMFRDQDEIDSISEKDAKSIITLVMGIQEKMLSERKGYIKKLSAILPYRKIVKLQMAERQFKRKLFEELKKRRKKFRE